MADANVRGRILIGEKMYSRIALLATTFIATLSLSFSATAHVTLEQQSAIAGSTYKAVVRVPHGCGVSPTTSITVFLPDGFIGAKPMPKAGWNLSTTIEKLAVPFDSHGTMIETRPAVIKWSGGLLQDSEYDEFIFRVSLPAAPAKYWLRVLQECKEGATDWAEIPVEGLEKPAKPAMGLDVTPKSAGPAAHH